MKKTLFIITLSLSISCSSQKYFKILESTAQKWSGGRARTGYGIRYQIKLIAKTNTNICNLDTLWVSNRFYKITTKKFSEGDTITITATERNYQKDYAPEDFNPDYNRKPMPLKTKASAVIKFRINDKVKYLKISKFQELPFSAYP